MKNIVDLRKSLAENYDSMKKGNMAIPLGKELSNTAGKMISSVKAEMEYNKMVGKKDKKIDFLED